MPIFKLFYSSCSMLVFSTLENACLPETMQDDHGVRLYHGVGLNLGRPVNAGGQRHTFHFRGQPVQLTLLKAGNDTPTTGLSLNYGRLATVAVSPAYTPWYAFSHAIDETCGVLLLPTKACQRPCAPPDTFEQAHRNYLITFFDWSGRKRRTTPPLHRLPLFGGGPRARTAA